VVLFLADRVAKLARENVDSALHLAEAASWLAEKLNDEYCRARSARDGPCSFAQREIPGSTPMLPKSAGPFSEPRLAKRWRENSPNKLIMIEEVIVIVRGIFVFLPNAWQSIKLQR